MNLYVFEILRTTDGDIKTLQQIEEVHANSVRFTDQTTNGKSMIKEVDEWISLKDHKPEGEVIALGYQDEILIGYVYGDNCESESEMLENVTHWRPKPFTINEVSNCL